MLNSVYRANLAIPISFSLYFYWQSIKFYLLKGERIISAWNYIAGVILLVIASIYSTICGLGLTIFNFRDNMGEKPFSLLSKLKPHPVIFLNFPLLTVILTIWSLYGFYLMLGDVNTTNHNIIKSFTINSALTQLLSIVNCGIFVYYMTRKRINTSVYQQRTN